jgi:uncharacterized protein (DUF2267 family)
MSVTGLEVFDDTVQKTNIWLKEIEAEIGPDRHRAYVALRGVLHALRDRLPPAEALDLASQLPMLVRGLYGEGYRLAGKPEKTRSADEFLDSVAEHFHSQRPLNPEDATRAVFSVLTRHCDAGEVRQVIHALPDKIRALWPRHEELMQREAVTQ